MNEIERLSQRLIEISEECLALTSQIEADKREQTEEETAQLQTLTKEFDTTEERIQVLQKIEAQNETLNKGVGRKTEPDNPAERLAELEEGIEPTNKPAGGNTRQRIHAEPVALRGKCGWHHLGDFASAVQAASLRGANPNSYDKRLTATTTFGNETVGADGGFAVPPDFRDQIMVKVLGEDSLLGLTDQMVSTSNSLTIPVDETTAWQDSGGILANWEGEGSTLTQTKPSLNQVTLRLNKLSVLVPITDELLDDSAAMASYLGRKAPDKINFKVNLAIVQGTGAGQPLGILNSPATITLTTSQTADTVVFDNIINMWSRLYAPSRANAVWLINQDIEPELMSMAFTGTNSPAPMYIPPGGLLSETPFGRLMGRPVIITQACETLGDVGDIILADLSQYLTAQKTGGIRTDTSIHLWFDQDIMAFRFIMRLAGQPWLGSTIAVRDGSNTLSSFIMLDERT